MSCNNCVKQKECDLWVFIESLCRLVNIKEGMVKLADACKDYSECKPETAGQKWAKYRTYPGIVCRVDLAKAYDQGQADMKPEPAMTAENYAEGHSCVSQNTAEVVGCNEPRRVHCDQCRRIALLAITDYIKLNKNKVIQQPKKGN